jgi:hypothetical protein
VCCLAIEFLFVILYLLLNFYKHVTKTHRDLCTSLFEKWNFITCINFSHFNQLLWSHWANLNQTLVEWSLDGSLPKLCPVILTSNQDGHQAKNRKWMEGGAVGHNFEMELPKDYPSQIWFDLVQWSWLPTKMATRLKIENRGDEILIVHCCFSISQNELKF